ncbi:hypothetical protein [Paenibacillus alvei]|uniref:hypothetical protein n=1 Tax=Paenibacillus alvei TaxID=44250 RepID=UPI0004223A59|nr:hypothetical protein [Paenibacillus alvei]
MIEKVSVAWNRHVIELVLDLGYEIVYRNGYLIAEDYLVMIKHHDWTMDYDFHFVEAVS